MGSSQPDPRETTTDPVRANVEPTEAGLPPEVQTVALRPGGTRRLLAEEKVIPPADVSTLSPAQTELSNDCTVAYNKVAQARSAVPVPPAAAPDPEQEPAPADGGTISIHQVKRMREVLEAPAPPSEEPPPGTTTVPIRRGTAPRLIPESATRTAPTPEIPAASPESSAAAPPTMPVRPRPSAPGMIRPRPSAPGVARPPTPPESTANLDPKLLCPRCRTKLVSPESLGMCPACGYCRSLEEGKDKVPPPKKKGPSLFGLVEFCQLLALVPAWVWILVGGMAGVILVTAFGPYYLLAEGPPRAWWGTVQFVIGIVTLAAAQGLALFQVGTQDERLGPLDLVLPARVWRLVLERLPRTRHLVWLLGVGLALTFSALFLSGLPFTGLGDTEGVLARDLREALKAMKEDDYQSLQIAAQRDLKAGAPAPAERDKDTRPTRQCAVIGYTRDAQGKPNGVIVATSEKGRLQYAGIIRAGVQKSKELLQKLGVLEKVTGPSQGGAVWVKPEVTIDVHHSGTGKDGTLNEPNLGGLAKSE